MGAYVIDSINQTLELLILTVAFPFLPRFCDLGMGLILCDVHLTSFIESCDNLKFIVCIISPTILVNVLFHFVFDIVKN